MKPEPPVPAIAISAGEFAYAPPPPVYPVLIALPSGFKFVADMRPLPPLPPRDTTFTEPETSALFPPVFPWFVFAV